MSYKDTLNLPKTDFPMKAGLTQREPETFAGWHASGLYRRTLEVRQSDPTWILHDGPPFANSDIHIGHLINKTLKDVFIRYKTLAGFKCPYVPGYDCHGLPIEHKIQQQLGPKLREMSQLEVRRLCHEHAAKYVKLQSEQFKRLGILGDWENPYQTMAPEYEAGVLEVFARFVEQGLVYRQLKPVHWSVTNQTALADAELEYHDVDDTSVYVEFSVANPGAFKGRFDLRHRADVNFLIWTTTPWTLPANLAIAAGSDISYSFVKYDRDGDRIAVVATDLVKKVFARIEHEVLGSCRGEDLLETEYRHPFVERTGRVLPADYVTTTDGTGLVHTAPGHGEEDYQTGLKHGLEVYCPVQADGRFDSTTPNWLNGIKVWEANGLIVQKLKELGALFAEATYRHSYPHDWRSKDKTILRAAEQWFIAIDRPMTNAPAATLRGLARHEASDEITFIPKWGQQRMEGMLANRPDWCLSRQRAWGLPIPVFYNPAGEPLLTPESVRAVARTFLQHGSDAWFTMEPAQLLGEDFNYPAGFAPDKLRKERDIFDVWFESGNSWHAVLQQRPELHAPADLYLEGSDQHRGWFQLSLLPALAVLGKSPFASVLTHGFAVKPDGTKVSKSDPEYVTATQEINRHGADVLRLWTSSVDYSVDLPVSPKVLEEFADTYRKIRNTLRFLLGNVADFDPAKHAQPVPANTLDGWASHELDELIRGVRRAYDNYQTHRAFKLMYEFCTVTISAVYGNAMKDRLYCELPDSPVRRRCQTVMHRMAVALIKLLSPMIVFTADEAWSFLAHKPAGEAELESVHLSRLPEPAAEPADEQQTDEWSLLMALRDKALLQLDRLKKEQGLNKSTDAEVIYKLTARSKRQLSEYGEDLADLVAAGGHAIADADADSDDVEVLDRREAYKECARSRKRRADVGQDAAYPDLTARDAAVMRALA